MYVQMALISYFIIKFAWRELKQMHEGGYLSYFLDIWNYQDLGSITLNIWYITLLLQSSFQHDHDAMSYDKKTRMRTIAGFSSLLMCIKMFYWMKIYQSTGYFLAQLEQTFEEIPGFLIMLVLT